MSKIIEALESVRVFGKKETPPSSNPSSSQTIDTEKRSSGPTSYQMTQQELADVYFARSGKTAKPVPTPTLIRVEDKRRNYRLPWIVTTLALILCSLALFSTKRVMIQIQILDADSPAPSSSYPSRGARVHSDSASHQIRLAPSRFIFSSGAAQNVSDSKDAKDMVVFSNRTDREQAFAAVTFDPPFNASGYVLQFEAKGAQGGETLELVFRDIDRQSSLNTGAIRPFPIGLTARWEKAEVVVPAGSGFDATRVAQMRFEIGSRRTGNPQNTVVSMRNVRWIPRRAD